MGQYSHKSKSEVWRERFQKKVVLIRMVSHHSGFTSTVMTCFQNAQLEHGSQLWQTVAAAADITHDPTVQNLHWPPAETTPADATIRRWSHWKGEHLGGGQLDYKMWTMWWWVPQVACILGDLKCWGAWDTTCRHKAKAITPLMSGGGRRRKRKHSSIFLI